LRTFDAIDKVLFAAIPPLRRWAWITVIRLAEPKKS
jgi:hypothetical protein